MKSRRPYRKPRKKPELFDQGAIARKAAEYAFKAKAAREFKEKGIVQRPMARGWSTVLTQSAKRPGYFQITRFDEHMDPVGDTERATLKEAVDALYWDAYGKQPKKVPLLKGLSKPSKMATVRIGTRVFKV